MFCRMNPLGPGKQLTGHTGLVDRVRIKDDLVISSGSDRQVRLWCPWSSACIRILHIPRGLGDSEGCFPMTDIFGCRIVAVDFDQVYVWELSDEQRKNPSRKFQAPERVTHVKISKDELMYSSGKDVFFLDFWNIK